MKTYEQFKELLAEKGYQYGEDAASNAYLGYTLAYAQIAKERADKAARDADKEVIKDYPTAQLYGADPNCKHRIVAAMGGGVKCTKCAGWYCI